MKKFHLIIVIFLVAFKAYAIPRIDITKGNAEPLPVAINTINAEDFKLSVMGQDIHFIIKQNLERSGLFRPIAEDAFIEQLAHSNITPNFLSWRQINASALFVADIRPKNGRYVLNFKLWDPYSEKELIGKSYFLDENIRRTAHKISDDIYKSLTGEEGYFNTKVAFIAEFGPAKKRIKRLAIMDQDGMNIKLITSGEDLTLTPRFSPDSRKILYMSYKSRVPHVFLYDTQKNTHKLVGSFPGMSFAPKFSPDGREAVMSVAQNGSSDIFIVNLSNMKTTRLTHGVSIDTSPHFSPDNSKIVFSSDRGSKSQLYVMNRDGSDQTRISFGDGSYFTPAWSPRGDFIAFTKIYQGNFHIGVMRPDGTGERILTAGYLVEGPSWSPNGRVIIFTRGEANSNVKAGKSVLEAIDLTGYHNRILSLSVEASDPNWSNLLD